ncbi:hypothetical protein QUA43_31120 [Microcoleus sp. N9_B4]|uniref:hypothetical protein n=1 Tax=Microcoleus sp. N9_B4 TaxID=3055386 RepID=UPI002FCE9F8C
MYTLEQLQQKNLKELKEIGWQLNVVPEGDRRCRQNWIDALIGVQPPLLQLLEVPPAAQVEPVEAIEPVIDNAFDAEEFRQTHDAEIESYFQSLIEVQAQEPIEVQRQETRFNLDICWVVDAEDHFVGFLPVPADEYLSGRRSFAARPGDRVVEPGSVIIKPIEVQAQEPIETPPGVESKFGRMVYPRPIAQKPDGNKTDKTDTDRIGTASPGLHHSRIDTAEPDASSNSFKSEVDRCQIRDQFLAISGDSERDWRPALPDQSLELTALNDEQPPNRGDGKGRIEPKLSQSAIVPAAKNSPGVTRKTSTAHQLLELFKSSAVILDDSPVGETEAELLESAIVPATENLPRSESDPNPILTGIRLSDTFLARYSPPQPEIIHYQSDPDGQLSLLNFEVESVDEPPDPDDFPSIDAFNEAMARWDAENSEALMVSMDSMCEWAPCPAEWYEPEPSEVMEVAPSSDHLLSSSDHYEGRKCWNFSIPTFDAWCDRAARQTDTDEPPDTGSFAKLPGPKPPKFPPMSVAKCDRANSIRKFARGAICAIGRAPPGGDAMH